MYEVKQSPPSDEFKKAWSAAGRHIQNQADVGLSWLRATLNPPMAEHLSFRIGNQIFFVFVEAAEFDYQSGADLFNKVCDAANAIPCIMPMEKTINTWRPSLAGWGLRHAGSGKLLNPLDYVTDELIEMKIGRAHV